MPTSDLFQNLYKKLNKAQKEAVDTVEGPVMVVAGPGTGKTQILSLRIANILLKTDAAPGSILAIAFTESAVKAMRKRLISIIGTRAYQIPIYTFHAFANDRIQEFPDSFPRIIGGESASDMDRISLIEEILVAGEWAKLRPSGDPLYYVKPVLSAIQSIKREGYTPETFLSYVQDQQKKYDAIQDKVHIKGAYKGKIKAEYIALQEKIEKNLELQKVFDLYEQKLREKKIYDFEDMIIEVAKAMQSDEQFLRLLQERYQYILVDEYQDTNGGQNKLVDLLASFHPNPNIFVVGDDKQAVYRFQGASLENFLSFKKRYPDTKVVVLKENYRSSQPILDSSHELIIKNPIVDSDLIAPLRSQLEAIDKITILEAPDQDEEYRYITTDIKKRLEAGIKPEEIALIYRDNSDADRIVRFLETADITYSVASDNNIFDDRDISRLIDLLNCLAHFNEEEYVAKILLFDFIDIPLEKAMSMIVEARTSRTSIQKVIEKEMPELHAKLIHFARRAHNESLCDVIESIMHDFGFMKHILFHSKNHDKADKVRVVLHECERFVLRNKHATIADFTAHIDRIRSHKVPIRSQATAKVGVQLMTAHRSKGLEFDVVYIINATDGHWSNKRLPKLFHLPGINTDTNKDTSLEDDRRLFFVAMTRARHALIIGYERHALDGKELFPVPFIEEIGETHFSKVSLEERKLPEASQKKDEDQTERMEKYRHYIESLFHDQGLSVTALNNYLTCPWEYFFKNLLCIPAMKSKPELYGTAIHEALRYAAKDFLQDGNVEEKKVIGYFERGLERLPLTERDFNELKKRGSDALGIYLKHANWQKDMKVEFKITTEIDGIELRGNLDRIDLHDNGELTVVDYKTGSPKTRNHIMGKTKDASGDYLRQLTFYKILISSADLSKFYRFKEGVIDFVEPDEKGNHHREAFVITDEEVEALQAVIKRVASEITSLSFISHVCEDESCEYCQLAKSLKF